MDCEHTNRRINERFERLSGCDEEPEREVMQKRRREAVQSGGDTGWEGQSGRGSSFLTSASVLVSCNLSSDGTEGSKRGLAGALEETDAGGEGSHPRRKKA